MSDDTIRALALHQPWASLLVHGAKKIETRSWKLPGPFPRVLAIHASKTLALATKRGWLTPDLPDYQHYFDALVEIGCHRDVNWIIGQDVVSMTTLPLGAVIGLVRVRECLPTEMVRERLLTEGGVGDDAELAFGDYSPNRWGWVCDRFHVLAEPIKARGCLGIWQWQAPAEVLAVAEEMGR